MFVKEGTLTATVCFEWSGFAKGQSFVVGEVTGGIHTYIHTYIVAHFVKRCTVFHLLDSQFTDWKPEPMVSDWSLQNRTGSPDAYVCMYVCM